jgi:hypothetical protein
MKRRELIKSDLNPPYTRLCKEEIKPSAKLFGEELPKHLKDMAEAKKVGQQMQKSSTSRPPGQIITWLKVTSRHLCAPSLMIAPAIHSLPEVLFRTGSRLDSGESSETKQYCPQSQGTVTKQVCDTNSLSKICKDDLAEDAKKFKAGCLQNYITKWES